MIYLPTNAAVAGTVLVARVHGDPERARETLVKRLATIDPALEQSGMEQVGILGWITRVETYLLQVGFWFTTGLGALALALTLSGLFSVLSYLVEQRTREIGVRMALGATPLGVQWLVLRQALGLVLIGLGLGVPGAIAFSQLLSGLLFEVTPLDPRALIGSVLLLLAGAAFAAFLPARRASRLNPVIALRSD